MARAALAQRGRLDPEVVVRLTGQLMLLSFVGTVFFWVATRFAHRPLPPYRLVRWLSRLPMAWPF